MDLVPPIARRDRASQFNKIEGCLWTAEEFANVGDSQMSLVWSRIAANEIALLAYIPAEQA